MVSYHPDPTIIIGMEILVDSVLEETLAQLDLADSDRSFSLASRDEGNDSDSDSNNDSDSDSESEFSELSSCASSKVMDRSNVAFLVSDDEDSIDSLRSGKAGVMANTSSRSISLYNMAFSVETDDEDDSIAGLSHGEDPVVDGMPQDVSTTTLFSKLSVDRQAKAGVRTRRLRIKEGRSKHSENSGKSSTPVINLEGFLPPVAFSPIAA